ncbi:DNA mismatch repair protein PMS2 [Blastomyces silverae]|uniref:DNA mismatch repair protein PMS1 n=1 Tax=Blastomyces silverae TaxID=2060906 RepID=A0A0H1BJH5_9EURO|nr:DNA mismatch repair protein PMS2 [Blastomyces silverae]
MATIKAIEARSVHQIQSGQVIVDLCSVVKELVENSLDAGATSLDIRFKNNGLDLIEVQDNGKGISPDDYETVALKHYTSKLSKFDDLSSLQTFGFRGEALSSLCALSNFHIITAQAHQTPKASRLEFETSGKLKNKQVVAGQKGTITSVENLFNTLPVRRRELEKNIKREYGKVLGLLHAYACVSTGVRFNVKNQMPKGKSVLVFATQSNASTKENISNIYGAKTLLALTPLDLELEFQPSGMGRRLIGGGANEGNKIFVQGHISKPVFGEGRQTPDRQMFFVNSRPCALPQIAKAFNEVYKSFNISQSPFIFADFKMDTNSYDVNVSPDKRTILLHDAGALIESLKTSLTGLFERQDQTVPHSQVSGKQSMLQHPSSANIPSSLGSEKPAESSEPRQSEELGQSDKSDEEDEQRRMRTFVQRFAGRSRTSDEIPETQQNVEVGESPASTGQYSTTNESVPQPRNISPAVNEIVSSQSQSCDHETSTTASPSTQFSDKSAENRANSGFTRASSLLRQEPLQSVQSSSPQHTPNVIQNAFDRMRPSRPPVELATITVGNRTVTSTIGREQFKRKLGATSLGGSAPRPKRRIHVSTSKSKLGQGLRLFAAPGTQVDDDLENISSEDEQAAVEAGSELESVSEHHDEEFDETHSERESEHEGEEDAGKHGEGKMEETGTTEPYDEAEASDSDASYDEQEEKAREEARVAELIQAAEEKASIPSDDTIHRVNKISKRSIGRTSTVDLVGSIDGSLARIEAHMKLLQEGLQNINNINSTTSEGEITEQPHEPESAETRLSLSVSKEDFAKMRIIGQFNLGFIIATRPRGDSNNPSTLPGRKHDEVFIIDQHASDEKYNFERLQAETCVQNQRLVKPKTLDLTAVEEEIIIDNLPALEKNGFVVEVDRSGDEPIGRRCKLTSLPLSKEVVFNTRDLEELIVLLGETPQTQTQSAPSPTFGSPSSPATFASKYIPRPSKVRKMFAMRACRSSIMIGKTLTTKQMDRVVRHMGMIDKPWNCPHGRPTMRHLMSLGEWSVWDEWESATQLTSEDGGDVRASTRLDVWKRFLGDLDEG